MSSGPLLLLPSGFTLMLPSATLLLPNPAMAINSPPHAVRCLANTQASFFLFFFFNSLASSYVPNRSCICIKQHDTGFSLQESPLLTPYQDHSFLSNSLDRASSFLRHTKNHQISICLSSSVFFSQQNGPSINLLLFLSLP